MKIMKLGVVILLLAPLAAMARPQDSSSSAQAPGSTQQQDSLADAARRAQAEKKDQPKATKVWDNDTVASSTGTVSVVGQEGQADGPSDSSGSSQQSGAPMTPEQKAAINSDLDAAKAQLASLKTDLDILQRKYSLDQNSYIGNPNHEHDKAAAKALDNEKADIDAKQQEIADAQKKIDDLQAQANAASK